MPEGLFEKIVAGALRAVTTLILGSGGYQLFDGRWYGETIFRAYLQSRTLDILTAPTTTDLYGLFAAQSVPGSLRDASGLLVLLFLLVGLIVLAHIISKPNIEKLADTFQRPPLPRAIPLSRADRRAAVRFIQWIYVEYQPLVTLLLFMILTGLFFAWPFRSGLALAFLIAVIPAALYLLLYPSDLSKGEFLDRFAYVGILAMLVVSLFGWPQLYGTAVFDPDFPIVSAPGAQDHCDEARLFKGPSFVAYESADAATMFRVCFDRTGEKKYVDFFSGGKEQMSRLGRAKLSEVIATFVKPSDTP